MQTGKLIIIDDEESLLRLMQIYLQRVGYQVTPCATLESAITKLENDSDYSTAIIDLSVVNDIDSLQLIAEQFPTLRMLVCSGNLFEVDALPASLQPRFGFVQKPFLPAMLVQAVEEIQQRTT